MKKLKILSIILLFFFATTQLIAKNVKIRFIIKLDSQYLFEKKASNKFIQGIDVRYNEVQNLYSQKMKIIQTKVPFKFENILKKINLKGFKVAHIFSSNNVIQLYSLLSYKPVSLSVCNVCNSDDNFSNYLELSLYSGLNDEQVNGMITIVKNYLEEGASLFEVIRIEVEPSNSVVANITTNTQSLLCTDWRRDIITFNQPYLEELQIGHLWKYCKSRDFDVNDIGRGIPFADIENGWSLWHGRNFFHYDFSISENNIRGYNYTPNAQHGTQVIGIILSRHKPYLVIPSVASPSQGFRASLKEKCTGISPGTNPYLISNYKNNNDATKDIRSREWAFLNAILAVSQKSPKEGGQVILIETEVEDGDMTFPWEKNELLYKLIELATNCLNISVIEPAGNTKNGTHITNLDDYSALNRSHTEFKDSGAIMVSSVNFKKDIDSDNNNIPDSEDNFKRLNSTNFGSRIDCYVWGENIYTTNISNGFSCFGESSASSAIIAGIATSLQWYARKQYGFYISPCGLRDILKNSNTISNDKYTMPNYIDLLNKVDNYFIVNLSPNYNHPR